MADYSVTLACRNYDRTQAIIRGTAKAEGVGLRVVEPTSVPKMFGGLVNGEYDVAEFSMAELVYSASREQNQLVAIPVFPLRMFRHAFIFCNTSAGIEGPESLDGKRIGFYRVAQTACVWVRGILIGEYNLSPERTQWYTVAIHAWDDPKAKKEVKTRDGSVIRWLEDDGTDLDKRPNLALVEGKIDALGGAMVPRSFVERDKRVRRLIQNYRQVEVAYFKKTGIFPIMHALVARKSVIDQHPDLPEKLFKLFVQAKKSAREWIRAEGALGMAWNHWYLDEEEEIFRQDPWAYGLERNSHVISKFLSYCYDLGVCENKLNPKDLFHPSTWDLKDE
jgi:4,5-dihydroxyphthalate decarboxylase